MSEFMEPKSAIVTPKTKELVDKIGELNRAKELLVKLYDDGEQSELFKGIAGVLDQYGVAGVYFRRGVLRFYDHMIHAGVEELSQELEGLLQEAGMTVYLGLKQDQ